MNTNEPLLSIIIPFFNAESTIQKCLESVLNQSYNNIEIICVDDGSTDSTVSIIKRYADERIVVFQKDNGGNYSARNMGLDKARGEFISMLDADDFISPDYVDQNIKLLLEDNDLDIVQVPFFTVDVQYRVVNNSQQYCGYLYNETDYLRAYFEGKITPFVTNKIIRSSVYDKFRFPILKCSGDSYVQPYLARYARKTYLSDVGCYFYYQNPQSITKTKYNLEKTNSSLIMHCHTYATLYNNLHLRDLRAPRFLLSMSIIGYGMSNFGYEFGKSYVDFFGERVPTLSDVLCSKMSVKKKVKMIILKIVGLEFYYKIVKYFDSN